MFGRESNSNSIRNFKFLTSWIALRTPFEKAKRALEEGAALGLKKIKAIKFVDQREFGWLTVNEHLSDELTSNSDNEKKMFRAERRAERKVAKDKRRRQQRAGSFRLRSSSYQSSASVPPSSSNS